jgi:hypothetical protein
MYVSVCVYVRARVCVCMYCNRGLSEMWYKIKFLHFMASTSANCRNRIYNSCLPVSTPTVEQSIFHSDHQAVRICLYPTAL